MSMKKSFYNLGECFEFFLVAFSFVVHVTLGQILE